MQAFCAGQSPPAFFYCSRNTAEPTRSSTEAVIASIARQLSSLQPGLPLLPPTVATYKRREAEGFASGPLRMDESRALILQLVEYYPLTTIVIDALDECDLEKRVDLLETLEEILQESSRLVKIFVSSRDDQDIVCYLQDYPSLELASDRNMDDIASFVRAETQDLIKRRKLLRFSINKEELKERIIDQVTKDANGMFRWASLQLQSLCGLTTDAAVRERLGRLPPKLEDLYLELYEKLNKYPAEADRQITRSALSWLLCAQRRLTSMEFLAALSIASRQDPRELAKEHVLELCCNMIVFDSTLDTFRFVHLSVREFLEKRPEYSTAATNSLAAETCLLELLSAVDNPATKRFLSEQGQSLENSAWSYNLSSYSTIYWARHCQLAGIERTSGALRDFFLFFLSNESDPTSAFALWTSRLQKTLTYGIDWELHKRLIDTQATEASTLFVACSFDFPEILRNWVVRQFHQGKFSNKRGLTALEVAVNHGSCDVILVLISDELTEITEEVVQAAAGNEESGTEVMALLLEQRGADVQITERVVQAAARNEESGEEVMALLLERRAADVEITKGVVISIARNLDKAVMTLLLERRGADVQITEEVVQAAARNQQNGKDVMALLLEQRGADVQITEEMVQAAARNRQEVMALLLEQRGADIHITEEVVISIARNFDKAILTLLLEQRGADVQIWQSVEEGY